MSENAITIRNLTGGYEDNTIIRNLSLELSKGGLTAIAGPNGAGKSTLLKYLIKELR
ncbi:MAG: ATP-binding cassette domain-containing protein, partial [Spirochaetales bacterium]|nr:ATP-binding cassette domain-containing protein [Spirochaetales bacterium]